MIAFKAAAITGNARVELFPSRRRTRPTNMVLALRAAALNTLLQWGQGAIGKWDHSHMYLRIHELQHHRLGADAGHVEIWETVH